MAATPWRKVKLKEVCQRITVGHVGPMADKYINDGIPFLRSQNISPFQLDTKDIKFIPRSFHQQLQKSALNPGDVAVVRTGYPGTACVIPPGFTELNCADLVVITPSKDLNPYYLAAIFNSAWGRASVAGNLVGVAQQHFNIGAAKELVVELPPRLVQDRFAGILSAYDDLIENNQRRIKILESMGRALYREWFVNFRFPGYEKYRRVASPLGDIPDSWECLQLANLINVLHGYAFKGEYFSDEPTSQVLTTPGNFKIGGGIKYDRLKFYREDGPLDTGHILKPMDLVLTMTDLSKTGDTLGFPAFIPKLGSLSFLHNQRVGRVVPLSQFFPKHFLYCLLCDERYRHHILGGATGTSVKHTSPGRILSYAFALPKEIKLIDVFENLARPIFQQMNVLIEEVQNLRHTRDMLLPRLLSGQVQLQEM